MTKLWQKNKTSINKIIEKYTVGDDYLLDENLILYDLQASVAHAKGLCKIGILNKKELVEIINGLNSLRVEWKKGGLKISVVDEDCHTFIENYLIKKIGTVGKKIHTGRSRNDQVLVALRLYMKDKAKLINSSALKICKILKLKIEKFQNIPMVGYSHMQPAMLSSVGHYLSVYYESLFDDLDFLTATMKHLDKSPLGSAAGFGVNLPLERAIVAKELGFSSVQINSLYCQNSKGKFESLYLESLAQIMMTLGRLANDLLLFTMNEFQYFSINESLTTGSSIMPQKKNLDVLELVRANCKVVINNQLLVKNISSSLLSGYNRDTQLIKKPVIESTNIVLDTLQVMELVVQDLAPNKKQIESKIPIEILAADKALELVKLQGIPFRDAYQQALELLPKKDVDWQKELKKKISLGAAGNLGYKRRFVNYFTH